MRNVGIAVRVCALLSALAVLTGCGFKIAGPGETISIAPLASEDLAGSCKFDMNLPDEPYATADQVPDPNKPLPTQVAALVIYERGDSASLFNNSDIQDMAAKLHMVTVFARQCNAKNTGDIQDDPTKGPARALFAALSQYAANSHHPEIASVKLIVSGFSAAGYLAVAMEKTYPDRMLTVIPYATGSAYHDLDAIDVTPAMAQVPTLILANAYDSSSGDQKSYRLFQKGMALGAVWGFGVQNHTGHCCAASIRDVMIPWVSALTPVVAQPPVNSAASTGTGAIAYKAFSLPATLNVSFSWFTDGWPDSQGENDYWIPAAAPAPTGGGPLQAWVPDATTADAWYKWVMNPGTN